MEKDFRRLLLSVLTKQPSKSSRRFYKGFRCVVHALSQLSRIASASPRLCGKVCSSASYSHVCNSPLGASNSHARHKLDLHVIVFAMKCQNYRYCTRFYRKLLSS
jgi:hypothetical protein